MPDHEFDKMTHDIKELCINGLIIDGGHHKQWYLEEILKRLGFDLDDVRKELLKEEGEYEWEPGIAP